VGKSFRSKQERRQEGWPGILSASKKKIYIHQRVHKKKSESIIQNTERGGGGGDQSLMEGGAGRGGGGVGGHLSTKNCAKMPTGVTPGEKKGGRKGDPTDWGQGKRGTRPVSVEKEKKGQWESPNIKGKKGGRGDLRSLWS